METAFGIQTGIELLGRKWKRWLAVSSEFILWKEIPSAFTFNLLQWGVRTFAERELSRSLTVFRINILWFDWEVFFVGGENK